MYSRCYQPVQVFLLLISGVGAAALAYHCNLITFLWNGHYTWLYLSSMLAQVILHPFLSKHCQT